MKKTKIIYWIVTGLFAAFMLFSAIPDVLSKPDAVAFVTKLGYPLYFIPFIGVAKILGSVALVIPDFPKIKEWAYAGLVYDLIAATYSFYALGYPVSGWVFMLLFIGFAFLSYYFYHRMLKETAGAATK
jgi:hypothetical protein